MTLRLLCLPLCLLLSLAAIGASLEVSEPAYSRPLPPGQTTGVVYLSLRNTGTNPINLSKVSTPLARSAEFHRHIHRDGMMQMRHLPQITLAAGKTLRFSPGGYHIMLFGVTKPLAVGDIIPLLIGTANGPELAFEAIVKAY
ncbi:MAG: copper chaperone PCu(A)C [Cellvibrionaceae bacterium]|nr:copper chaperone PCu(A)C [Cellvibrionaceae bacterium]